MSPLLRCYCGGRDRHFQVSASCCFLTNSSLASRWNAAKRHVGLPGITSYIKHSRDEFLINARAQDNAISASPRLYAYKRLADSVLQYQKIKAIIDVPKNVLESLYSGLRMYAVACFMCDCLLEHSISCVYRPASALAAWREIYDGSGVSLHYPMFSPLGALHSLGGFRLGKRPRPSSCSDDCLGELADPLESYRNLLFSAASWTRQRSALRGGRLPTAFGRPARDDGVRVGCHCRELSSEEKDGSRQIDGLEYCEKQSRNESQGSLSSVPYLVSPSEVVQAF